MRRSSTVGPGAIRTINIFTPTKLTLAVALLLLFASISPATAQGFGRGAGNICNLTAAAAFQACRSEARDDYWEAVGICLNDTEERDECLAEASEERNEALEECSDQREARLEICEELGQDAYTGWDDNEAEFLEEGDFCNDNPYLPIAPGNWWLYDADDETLLVSVYDEYKLIDDVTCIVVNDVGEEPGVAREDTDDWFAVDEDGTVHYCGEISQDFEYMPDDSPAGYELVEIEGSWKADRDGARSGILMPGDPFDLLGEYYRQEWAFGDAEDMGEMLSADYFPGEDEEIDEVLAELEDEDELVEALEEWCDLGGGCVVTRDFTPIEPDVEEFKFYAYGIGLVLEVEPPNEEEEEEGGFVILDDYEIVDPCDV